MRALVYISEGVKIAFNALRQYKMRSVLTTLGIVIGVSTVITIVALVQGLNMAFEKQISFIGTSTLYVEKYPWIIMSDEEWNAVRNRPNITLDETEKIEKYSQTAVAVAPALYTRRNIKYNDKSVENVTIVGSTANYLETSNALPEIGRFLSETDVRHRRAVCLIGQDVKDKLFPDSDPIGERINIGGRRFKVIGVTEKKGSFFGESQDQMAIIPIGNFQSAFGGRWRSVDIEVKVASPDQLEDAEIELIGIMRRIRGLEADEDDNFTINKQSMLMETYNNLTGTLWAVAIGVGAISLLVGGIGIMNILLVSVTERTREIGIRKAIGARKSDILLQFLIESFMICGIGVFIGTMMAIIFAKIVATATPLPAAITPWIAVLGIGFVLAIGLFFGIYPAGKAAKLNPIEALRYE